MKKTSAITYVSVLAALCLSGIPALVAAKCLRPLAGFAELAQKIRSEEDLQGVQVLRTELLVSSADACRGQWEVELLTEEGEVAVAMLDAVTLELRWIAWLEDDERVGDGDDDEDEIYPLRMRLTGGSLTDWVEGDWSDDDMSGGDGKDLFVVTPGMDVIRDFNPDEDLLDVGDFARYEDGFGTLRSISDIDRHSFIGSFEGQPALVIDIDGQHGDWTLTMVGVEIRDLNHRNVYFGFEEASSPLILEALPDLRIVTSDGSIVEFEGFSREEEPKPGRLIEGTMEALDASSGFREDFAAMLMDGD